MSFGRIKIEKPKSLERAFLNYSKMGIREIEVIVELKIAIDTLKHGKDYILMTRIPFGVPIEEHEIKEKLAFILSECKEIGKSIEKLEQTITDLFNIDFLRIYDRVDDLTEVIENLEDIYKQYTADFTERKIKKSV